MTQRPIAVTQAELAANYLRLPIVFPPELLHVVTNFRQTFFIAFANIILTGLAFAFKLEIGLYLVFMVGYAAIIWRLSACTLPIYRYFKPHFKFLIARRVVQSHIALMCVAAMNISLGTCGLVSYSMGWTAPHFG